MAPSTARNICPKTSASLIDAEFGLTEGGWGQIDAKGKRIALNINAGEKLSQNYTLEVTNPGGHSMRPVKDNAIYRLSAGLLNIGAYDFPVQTLPVTLEYFARMAPLTGGEMGAAMAAFAKNPGDASAIADLDHRPHPTTPPCGPHHLASRTLVNAGHATNALPQRATANVNCRIFPGTTAEQVYVDVPLQQLVADPQVKVTAHYAPRNEPTTTRRPHPDA